MPSPSRRLLLAQLSAYLSLSIPTKSFAKWSNGNVADFTSPSSEEDAYEALFQAIASGRYFDILRTAELFRARGSRADQDAVAQAFAMVGEEGPALRAEEHFLAGRTPKESLANNLDKEARGSIVPLGLQQVTDLIGQNQIVMINEAHHQSRHRAFVGKLALVLRKMGFAKFAGETFSPSISVFNQTRRLAWRMGTFTNDPVYAETLRAMSSVGYWFNYYDIPQQGSSSDPLDDMISRERRDAQFISGLLRDDPGARILIGVGYSHLSKEPAVFGNEVVPSLAQQIFQYTGIVPFCIDQVRLSPRATSEQDDELRTLIAERLSPTESVLIPAVTLGAAESHYADAYVFHPRVAKRAGRPGWRSNDNVCAVKLDFRGAISNGCRIGAAFRHCDGRLNELPSDVLVLDGEYSDGSLLLGSGRYRLRAENEAGFIDLETVEVDAKRREFKFV